jgi:hypothetical protein
MTKKSRVRNADIEEVSKWLNVKFVVKAFILVIM